MIVKQMIKEEWRMHSTLFKGRNFATFPLIMLGLSYLMSYAVLEYSVLGMSTLSNIYQVLGAFVGLSVGAMGFSSKAMVDNVMGATNFLVYSSRTLPVSGRKLLAAFIVKDLIYYTALFIAPVSIGLVAAAGLSALTIAGLMIGWFFVGLMVALIFARTSIKMPGVGLNYGKWMNPLSQKSVLDVWRSAGGIVKIVFSFGVLTGFYWTIALYFPSASAFLKNPLLSYSVLAGTISLTIYNWLNRFDSVEKYKHLPIDREKLLKSKQIAFLAMSTATTTLFLLISFVFYSSNLVLALGTALATQLYTLGIASYLTGLEPNSRLFDSKIFMEYLVANSIFVMPLLVLSALYTPGIWHYYIGLLVLTAAAGVIMAGLSVRRF